MESDVSAMEVSVKRKIYVMFLVRSVLVVYKKEKTVRRWKCT